MKSRLCILILMVLVWGRPTPCFAIILNESFSEDLAGFSITSPNPDWKFAPRSVAPGPVRATLRFKTSVDKFVPNVTVQVVFLNKKVPLEKWVEEDLSKLPKTMKVEEKKPIDHNGRKGFEIVFMDEASKLMFKQWIFLAKERSYVITCATKASTYPRFAEEFKMILNSFEIN